MSFASEAKDRMIFENLHAKISSKHFECKIFVLKPGFTHKDRIWCIMMCKKGWLDYYCVLKLCLQEYVK